MRTDFYVYCWTNLVNGKCYVGKGRKWRYKHPTFKGGRKSAISAAMRKYGTESFVVEMLHTGLTETQAFWLEAREIERHHAFGQGYNLTLGGEGASGVVFTPERLQKMKARPGKKHTLQTRLKMSESHKKLVRSPSHCAALSAVKLGKPRTPAVIAKMSLGTKASFASKTLAGALRNILLDTPTQSSVSFGLRSQMSPEKIVDFVGSKAFQDAVADAYRQRWTGDKAASVAAAIAAALKMVAEKAGY